MTSQASHRRRRGPGRRIARMTYRLFYDPTVIRVVVAIVVVVLAVSVGVAVGGLRGG